MSSIEKKVSLKQKPGHFVKTLKKKNLSNIKKKKSSLGKPFDVEDIIEKPKLIKHSDKDGSTSKKNTTSDKDGSTTKKNTTSYKDGSTSKKNTTKSNKIKSRDGADHLENVIEIDEQAQPKSSVSVIKTTPEIVPKLYIRFKKTIKAMGKTHADLVAMHPLIKSVRLPRKKENSKFFFAIFGSEAKALKASKALMERKDCYVRPAFKVKAEKSTNDVEPKKKLRYFWN